LGIDARCLLASWCGNILERILGIGVWHLYSPVMMID